MIDNTSPRGRGLFSVRQGDTQPVITNIRRLAGREADTGARLIAGQRAPWPCSARACWPSATQHSANTSSVPGTKTGLQ